MSTSKVIYPGGLRTQSTHLASGDTYLTFAPTDTVATGLVSCMITVMGIKAVTLDVDLLGSEAVVTKVMTSKPRRISEIKVVLNFPKWISEKNQKILEKIALTCPVAKSLH